MTGRNRNTVEFLGVWERVHNPAFNDGEFAAIRSQAGLNAYRISIKAIVQVRSLVASEQR